MNGTSAKKHCGDGPVTIGTHDGTFHCDEVLACWMLKQLPQYKEAEIVRTRDPAKLSTCEIVVDVGAVYDAEALRFDHHQRTFDGTMKSLGGGKWETKLSSAGLVYLHFGIDVIAQLTKITDKVVLRRLYDKIYERFIEEVDAVDNGIEQYSGTPRYHSTTNLGHRIGGLNPPWNCTNPDPQRAFNKAMEVCGSELTDRINYYKDAWIPARTLVEEAIQDRFNVHSSGEIIVFKHSGCPWKEHLFDIEEELNFPGAIKFVLYQDQHLNWRVQCVPESLGSFNSRCPLVEKWRGLRDETLSKMSGIPNGIFVHASGFIGGNKSYDGALEMAKITLTVSHDQEESGANT